ncbi:MAG: DUF4188 domain-containing protein [Acidimicrobiia bacterium]|nr:DUF4188 domain-containing protein [Acidimicrobiia bacterium]
MAKIIPQRMAPHVEGDFVVFLIGMRINRFHRPDHWWPVFTAMPRMLRELSSGSPPGLLGFRTALAGLRSIDVIQYWRSWEELHAYARNRDATHFPAWVDFNRRLAKSRSVGIWHETFLVRNGSYEAIYNSMPPYGLGAATELRPATGSRHTAKGRLGETDGTDDPTD